MKFQKKKKKEEMIKIVLCVVAFIVVLASCEDVQFDSKDCATCIAGWETLRKLTGCNANSTLCKSAVNATLCQQRVDNVCAFGCGTSDYRCALVACTRLFKVCGSDVVVGAEFDQVKKVREEDKASQQSSIARFIHNEFLK
jgi:hypothetical protein